MFEETVDPKSSPLEPEVTLDGAPVVLPSNRRSITAIRSYLETKSLEQQRVLCCFKMDGELVSPSSGELTPGSRIEAESIGMDAMPILLLQTASDQTAQARAQVASTIELVLTDDGRLAREYWWNLVVTLKQPLLIMSLLPESLTSSTFGSSSFSQLRNWQLQQLGRVIQEVDDACASNDSRGLWNVLQNRALAWLDKLQSSIDLWRDSLLCGLRAR